MYIIHHHALDFKLEVEVLPIVLLYTHMKLQLHDLCWFVSSIESHVNKIVTFLV